MDTPSIAIFTRGSLATWDGYFSSIRWLELNTMEIAAKLETWGEVILELKAPYFPVNKVRNA